MLIEKRFLPWGTQRAGCCTKLNANKRSHEKEDIVYCTVMENGGSDRILWEEIFYDLRNWGKELSYMASTTASTFRAKEDLLCSLPGTGNAIRSGACSTDASRYRESWDCVKRGLDRFAPSKALSELHIKGFEAIEGEAFVIRAADLTSHPGCQSPSFSALAPCVYLYP